MSDDRVPLISIHSHKGGVGKTTVATLISHALSREHKVCLVDLDLVAPGVAPMLGIETPSRCILHYLLGNPKEPGRFPKESAVCHEVTGNLHVIPGAPDHREAMGVQSYILAELRSGLIRARVERLLTAVRTHREIDVFVLDTPPSLFGLSQMARRLVEKHEGAEVLVVTPTVPDVNGLVEMAVTVDAERKKDDRAAPLQAVVGNRHPGIVAGRDAKQDVIDWLAGAESAHGLEQRTRLETWLEPYEVGRVQESGATARMVRVLQAGEERPSPDELLAANGELAALAAKLYERVRQG